MMGSEVIGNAVKEKYLGDWIHEQGCRESISTTIKERIQKLISKSEEIIQIPESPLMGALGDSTIAIRLFEAQILPALLFNSESWVDLSQAHLSDSAEFPGQIPEEANEDATHNDLEDTALGRRDGNDEVENS